MKKIISMLLAVLMLTSISVLFASAEDVAEVYVTIADKEGKLVLAYEPVTAADIDGDSTLTINDVLYAAHEQFYNGGAAAGYATEMTKFGLSLTKLWGVADGFNYGYMVNDVSAWSMTDPVATGDYIAAYVFTDTKTFADKYSFFDKKSVVLSDESSLTLTLTKNDFDEDWNPVTLRVAGAELTVDGEPTGVFTDNDGKATLKFTENGRHLVSASAANQVLVPPVCYVEAENASTPDEPPVNPPVVEGPDDDTLPTQALNEDDSSKKDKTTDDESTGDESTKDDSTKDDSTKDTAANGANPKTNDVTKLWLWIMIAAVCLCGIIGAVIFYKKRYGKK